MAEIGARRSAPGARRARRRRRGERVRRRSTMAVRDYVGATGFRDVLLGLSGGVDSALTLAIAVDALGRDRVRAVMMPSPYTATDQPRGRADDGRRCTASATTRCRSRRRSTRCSTRVATVHGASGPSSMEENLQARIRGALLMALSNRDGALLLTTGNKSEMAVGYATLYGDMAGGFAVLKDVAKTLVYRLAAWRNALGTVIPTRVLERPPSAELRAGPDRPGLAAAVRRARRDPRGLRGGGPRCGGAGGGGPARRRRARGGHAHPPQRAQAAPVRGRSAHHAARVRQGLALSDRLGVGRRRRLG